VGIEGSLTHVMKTFSPKSERQGEILEGDTIAVVQNLIGKMKEKKLI
jgi:electron transfer flavoprotein beta subunit